MSKLHLYLTHKFLYHINVNIMLDFTSHLKAIPFENYLMVGV